MPEAWPTAEVRRKVLRWFGENGCVLPIANLPTFAQDLEMTIPEVRLVLRTMEDGNAVAADAQRLNVQAVGCR